MKEEDCYCESYCNPCNKLKLACEDEVRVNVLVSRKSLAKTVNWMFSGYTKGYHIHMNGEQVHFTKDKTERDMFIATLKAKILCG